MPSASPFGRWLDFGGDDRSAVEIDDVLNLVEHVPGSVLAWPERGVGIVGVDPLLVGGLAPGTLAVEGGHRAFVFPIHRDRLIAVGRR
jgi:hypothetical protein